jgi:HK97 gp10 family phage protein
MAYIESGIYVEGLNQMVAGLTAMSSEATAEVQALNRKVGIMVRDEARQLVPVGTSGNLKESIRYSKGLYGAFVLAGNNKVPYANVQNWGWFYDKRNFIYKNIKPQQFVNKAAAKVREELSSFYVQELVKIYEKYSGKSGSVSDIGYNVKKSTVGRRR